jgi:hypothetical protein
LLLSAVLNLFCLTGISAEETKGELLPSWNDGPAKEAVLEYIKRTTSADSKDFIEEEDRIALFRDNGTLICENPGIQIAFLARSIKRLAKKDPMLLRQEPFRSVERKGMEYLEGLDREMLANIGNIVREKAGDEFYRELVSDFLNTANHPRFEILYKDLVYQPMKELLSYFRASGINMFIISSGDLRFIKRISNDLYGVSPGRVMDLEEYMSDYGKKPVIAAGRMKDGEDLEMLDYSRSDRFPTLQMLIKHDDGKREYRYGQDDRESIKAAEKNDWLQVSMKNDWKNVFAAALKEESAKKEPAKKETAAETPEGEAAGADVTAEVIESGPQIGITRPLQEEGPTNVYVGVFVIDVDEVNTVMQSFAANIYTKYKWWDPRLAHGGKGTVFYNLTDIWTPKILLLNRQRLWKSFPMVAEVDSSGEVTYDQRSWGYFSQPLDLHNFPFDEQTINFTFISPDYSPQETKLLIPETGGFGMAENFSVPDWDVVSWDYTTKPFIPDKDEELASITYSLKLKRHSEHYIYKIVIPLVFIVIMSWIVFWIDPKEVGTNVAAATTCFLTLVAYRFAISAYLPEIPYFTRLDALVFWSTILVFSSLIQTIVLSYLVRAGKGNLARGIDWTARFVYPAVFTVIIVFTLIK